MSVSLLDALPQRPLLADGAMGTQLMFAGLEQGNCGEAWNLTHPDRVLGIQRRYAEAGSDCIMTNTFGGIAHHAQSPRPRRRRRRHQHGRGRHRPRGVRRPRRLRDRRHRPVRRTDGAVRRVHRGAGPRRVQRAGRRPSSTAGADAIIIETQTSLEELRLGIEAAKEAGAPCIIGSMAYDVTLDGSTFRTMMGIDPERAAEFMEEHGADIVALNCGTGMDMDARARSRRSATSGDRPAGDGPAQRRAPKLIEHEGRLRRDARGDGRGRRPAARSRREHHRRAAAAARRTTSARSDGRSTSISSSQLSGPASGLRPQAQAEG